jgi:hypothetical protein
MRVVNTLPVLKAKGEFGNPLQAGVAAHFSVSLAEKGSYHQRPRLAASQPLSSGR